MAASNSRGGAPRRTIHDAYRGCLRARALWSGFSAALPTDRGRVATGFGGAAPSREDAHTILHAATMNYFETVQPYLASSPSGSTARDYWENAPLWPIGAVKEPGVGCAEGHQYADPDAAESPCPKCGNSLRSEPVPKIADDGTPIMKWLTGLKHLQDFVDETVTVEVDGGKWSVGSEKQEVPNRLEPDALLRVGRYIDEAASNLGLLAQVDEEQPLAEV